MIYPREGGLLAVQLGLVIIEPFLIIKLVSPLVFLSRKGNYNLAKAALNKHFESDSRKDLYAAEFQT